MAGIEKICEFSGDYPGSKMYKYKRNHIQICPKYRKLFRGADFKLVVTSKELNYVYKHGWSMSYDPQYKPVNCTIKTEYYFKLLVSDSKLQGEVKGVYSNWTYDLKDTVKRLKRMLRCRNIKVKFQLEK